MTGAVLLVAAILAGGDKVRLAEPDGPVNVGARDLGDISAHNSPTLARSPRDRRNLVVTSRIDSPDFSCALHVSRDAGGGLVAGRRPDARRAAQGGGPARLPGADRR